MKEFTSCLGGLVIILLLFVYGILVGGLLVDRFYYWFILPVFTGLPLITFYQAIGLSFFITLFRNHTIEDDEKKTKEEKHKKMAQGLAYYPVLLGLGWIVHLIIG